MSPAFARGALLVAAALFATPAVGTQGVVRDGAPDPFQGALWDDGRAEISVYRGTILRYGKLRPVRAKIIIVKEEMDLAQHVKADGGPVDGRTRTVLKMNTIFDYPTGTYDYHQMSSVCVDRSGRDRVPLKNQATGRKCPDLFPCRDRSSRRGCRRCSTARCAPAASRRSW